MSRPRFRNAAPAAPAGRAARLLAAAVLLVACRAPGAGVESGPRPLPPQLRADVTYLAADALEGRASGTAGNDSAATYLARRFADLGLAGLLPGGAYLQRFDARSAADAHAGRTTGRPTQNVAALLPGTDRALDEHPVVVGAHFDHLGRTTDGALDPQAGDSIRNGADDNASGTAAVLELARRLAARPTRRPVVFALFSGEELGVLGSQHFVANAPFAIEGVQAMVNFDMVGRLRDDRLIVYGTGTAAELPALLDSANGAPALRLSKVPDGFGPSDHSAFHARGLPVLHLFTDLHDDYHRASDDVERIDFAGLERVVDYAERVVRRLADGPPLTPIRTAAPAPVAGSSAGSGTWFGSVPDMGASDVAGLRLTGVTPGSPADRGGVKPGDVVVEFGGVPVTDLYSYTDALRARRPGDQITVVVLRGGERLSLPVTLGRRP